ncbi:MAG: epoxyqueuosine reductase QueH [Thermodesulfovibrio sp.]|uniref:epoxyqueuosine reductase QueH n=1 Tax=unclassified Thermodesulfovibrio TaxID=2645936 RepID=UPI00083B360A|nr:MULTISPECIES: epoxyqueuosine reductase QueH [unclassified Thermodesulfovibrio]MDI1472657.1 epoxyqueuosine reductase QueH [Thermodesulfovibrio sp. 1176]MDI6714807.1 epoxyqueuosine reductase QueH [Thermodesulfovibrio sp.]ODA44422.1 Diacylglucosamine hydrolase like [Thermodesulfovibrio sp. N1]
MEILLHSCCSNCAIYPLESLKDKGFKITLYWYNPNIHPYTEYMMRLDSLKKLEKLWNLSVIYDEDYRDFYKFIRMVSGREKERCLICYKLRLEKTAKKAKETGIKNFTTTLLVSPYQKFDKIIEIGKEVGEAFGVNFYAEDFRKGFSKAMQLSKVLELYKQRYCGCIYSEAERYLKVINYE